ncbi:MAG: hypothetical protein KJN60_12920 [Boseongicola sp.]|nr:hypothetical protein [Boseongicola sp.]
MSKVHRIAGLKISRVAVRPTSTDPLQDYWTPKDALPDLEPPEDNLRHIFSADTITLSHSSSMEDVFDPKKRPENKNAVARATVYVMNLIVLVMALPVGLALLFFNILFGENLRTTAHVIALTGMAMALTTMPGNADLLRFL